MHLLEQLFKTRVPAEAFVGMVVIHYVIAAVFPRRDIVRIQPDRRHAKLLHIIETVDNALEIAVSVPVRIHKAVGIYFVKNFFLQLMIHNALYSSMSSDHKYTFWAPCVCIPQNSTTSNFSPTGIFTRR